MKLCSSLSLSHTHTHTHKLTSTLSTDWEAGTETSLCVHRTHSCGLDKSSRLTDEVCVGGQGGAMCCCCCCCCCCRTQYVFVCACSVLCLCICACMHVWACVCTYMWVCVFTRVCSCVCIVLCVGGGGLMGQLCVCPICHPTLLTPRGTAGRGGGFILEKGIGGPAV